MIASWFLEEYSDLDYRFAVSEDLYCDEKKFVHACESGHLAVVKTLIKSSDKKILNLLFTDGYLSWIQKNYTIVILTNTFF